MTAILTIILTLLAALLCIVFRKYIKMLPTSDDIAMSNRVWWTAITILVIAIVITSGYLMMYLLYDLVKMTGVL